MATDADTKTAYLSNPAALQGLMAPFGHQPGETEAGVVMKMKVKLVGLGVIAFSALFLANSAEAQCRDGKNRRIKIINDTSYSLRELYGSNVGADSWQEDVLGRKVLGPGNTVTVNFDDGTCYCSFDLKAVFSDDTSTIRRSFNVCTETAWRIHE